MPDEKRKPVIHVIPANRESKRIRVALYCRVSTQMERQLNSLSAQMDFEREDILENPDWEYVDTYSDIKSGRTISARPGFRRLLADCEAGRIDMIYTKSISRFGRNCVDFLVTLRRLKELKVDVYFTNENIRLFSQAGELMLTLHVLVPELFWSEILQLVSVDFPQTNLELILAYCFGVITVRQSIGNEPGSSMCNPGYPRGARLRNLSSKSAVFIPRDAA